ncbi:MAG: acetyl-CoA carboxylase biotin carboxylase subunit [Planctomycetes bacterium]|nr:acetyl-CoA carboxylase biotin carboxylase subunit [Planctomycetota bacterium]
MFQKILIANRGEVAVRIARAARASKMTVVGVCSTADQGAGWLAEMDEVVCIGGPSPRESYLRFDRIVQAALQTGATAIHPGWGFLAENARFAALCEQHGITFIGPSPRVMEMMGLKSPAKAAMRAAGLDVIPGSIGLLVDIDDALKVAARVGYPLILKADAGGGGRGMRLCHDDAALKAGYISASNEAQSAFGNGALYLESYLTGGRHIEVQVIGDRFGHAVHLYERECSIQRNHQKLIEESPSPALTPDQREELGARAARAAASIGYAGAGTIEFLRAQSGRIHFMEMNTRLQVEHPVTEMITGIDIVQEQFNVAANRSLRLSQIDVRVRGHAIECRINAEDPADDFRPSPGVITRMDVPLDRGPGTVRVDTHVAAGYEVPPYYDSLIAKVIVHAPDRTSAIETMVRTLSAAVIEGVATTIPLHLAVLASAEFARGEYDTRSIPGWKPRQKARV